MSLNRLTPISFFIAFRAGEKLGKLFLSTEVEGFNRWVTGRPVASELGHLLSDVERVMCD